MNQPFLVAVDFSELTESTLERAANLASGGGNRIDLLHVVKPTAVNTRGNLAARQIVEQADQRKRDVAARRLSDLKEHIPAELRGEMLVRDGLPADVICQVAQAGYEMVVLATNGRTGLSHTLLGSVAERVVRYSPIPVLVVR